MPHWQQLRSNRSPEPIVLSHQSMPPLIAWAVPRELRELRELLVNLALQRYAILPVPL
jgi:hypothetical protein